MKVDIYARISQDRDGSALGVRDQVRRGREEAERRGWTVRKVHVDNDVSADEYPLAERPAGADLVGDAEDGKVEAVWAVDDDRLWRDEVEQRTVFALLAAGGVKTVVAGGREYDPTDDTDVTPTLLALLGRAENAQKKRRLRRKMRALAEEGKPSGGRRPFGYEDDHVTVREDEAEVIREVAQRILDGEAWRGVATDLNERGIPTVTGSKWHGTTLRGMLTAPRIAGLREHKGEVVGEAVWPGIISEEDWHRLKARVGKPSHRRGRRPKYLLPSYLRCGREECGETMDTAYSKGSRIYKCQVCYGLQVSAERVEGEVRDRVLAVLKRDRLAEEVRREVGAEVEDGRQRILDELAEVERRRDELLEAFEGGGSAKMLARASDRLEDRERELREELAQHEEDAEAREAAKMTRAQMREAWESGEVDRQRRVLRALVDHVVIHPATSPGVWDAERVEVSWRV